MDLFIEGVLLNEETTNIWIQNNHIAGIGKELPMPVDVLHVNGSGKAAFPAFANGHCHAPMTLFRGLGNDLPLDVWLNDWIWPNEKNLTDEIVYWGTKLACLEMIKNGTTAFNDMYFHIEAEAQAVAESGIRANLCLNIFGNGEEIGDCTSKILPERHERITFGLAPHAIYTVNEKGLLRVAEYCSKYGVKCHIHMSETLNEIEQCITEHGCRPFEYLDRIGFLDTLGDKIIAAHALHISEKEIDLIAKHNVKIVHNPNSNLKLGSGHMFLYEELRQAGVEILLGTDGCASSNNLDMIEAMKTMSLLQKGWRKNPTVLPSQSALQIATRNGFKAMEWDAGEIAEGKLADIILVDLNNIAFVPNNNTLSNLIYAAHGDCIDTVICNGRILMEGRHIAGEEEIVKQARKAAEKLIAHKPVQ